MEAYLCDIKVLANSHATLKSLLTYQELIELMLSGLPPEYDTFASIVTCLGTILASMIFARTPAF